MKLNKKFKKNPKYLHQRSEGLTKRGEARQIQLMLGNQKPQKYRRPCPHCQKITYTHHGICAYCGKNKL